ncbi:MAG: methyltransferase domain-containing protein [Anaerolineae bacterium]|nr:methyltransferase domain-containing protein [Anaerolineae bacterium]
MVEGLVFGRLHLLHHPAEHLPFPEGAFDLVCCLEALEFMVRPRAVVAELVRVTRPGGWLLLTNRLGTDARLMPGKAWSLEQAQQIYQEEFGLLEVEVQRWQVDYSLIWARKPGESLPTRSRPLEEVWCCPRCGKTALLRVAGAYRCTACEARVPVGADEIIEALSAL